MNQQQIVALQRLIIMSKAHIEDIESGLKDGTYDDADNEDLDDKREAVRAMELFIYSGDAVITPTAVVHLDGGVIEGVTSNVPLRVVFLDADIEGGDVEQIHTVQNRDFYVTDLIALEDINASDHVDPSYVQDVLEQVGIV